MRIVIAPQEFKGTLTAVEAATAIAHGIRAVFPNSMLDLAPMADGGPGTLDALLAGRGGERCAASATDPLGRAIDASWGRLEDGTAVIECAEASGLLRLATAERDPRRATSRGTGDLLVAALEAGCRSFIIGLGGSATNDGGAGLAQALGFRLLDAEDSELEPGGAALTRLAHIDASGVSPLSRYARVVAATDVTNPLCGPNGASAVYGPQKGADPAAVQELDAALAHFADVIKRNLGVHVADVPGAGAAGGLGAGLIAFTGATISPGAPIVAAALKLEERIAAADLVVTGEGRLDGQSDFGKTTAFVARMARSRGTAVVCIAGHLGPGYERMRPWFDAISVAGDGEELPSRELAREQIEAAASRAVLDVLGRGRVRGSL